MDLNELLFQHQVALLHRNSKPAHQPAAARLDLVGYYRTRIDRLREKLGVTGYPEWRGLPAGEFA